MSDKSENSTHFGYQQVSVDEKQGKVADVFHSVASRYDLMNDLMSLGIHRLWKRIAVDLCAVRKGQRVLDIAGGTGDLTVKFSEIVGDAGEVVLADINSSMLAMGRSRLIDRGIYGNVSFVQANAECLPFPDNHFDCISIAFGLRNVTNIPSALESMYRTLKPGGRVMILEFSKPTVPGLNSLYDTYSFRILPLLGELVAQDRKSYQYLAESIRMHPDQQTLLEMMESAGMERCEYFNMTGGIVAAHRGFKL